MTPTAPERHLIKKYANRKLYDTRKSRYITLDEIAHLVRAGDDIKVIDRGNGSDLTQVTLSQIVLSEDWSHRVQNAALPVDERSVAIECQDFFGREIQRAAHSPVSFGRWHLCAPSVDVGKNVGEDVQAIVELLVGGHQRS